VKRDIMLTDTIKGSVGCTSAVPHENLAPRIHHNYFE
jgi:hypothetical protein